MFILFYPNPPVLQGHMSLSSCCPQPLFPSKITL
jgi:hypothetical protein